MRCGHRLPCIIPCRRHRSDEPPRLAYFFASFVINCSKIRTKYFLRISLVTSAQSGYRMIAIYARRGRQYFSGAPAEHRSSTALANILCAFEEKASAPRLYQGHWLVRVSLRSLTSVISTRMARYAAASRPYCSSRSLCTTGSQALQNPLHWRIPERPHRFFARSPANLPRTCSGYSADSGSCHLNGSACRSAPPYKFHCNGGGQRQL
jgi:hypothetical protein